MANKEVPKKYYGSSPDDQLSHLRWWTEDLKSGQIHKRLTQLIRSIESRQIWRRIAQIRNARLYENIDMLGLYASTIYQTMGSSSSNKIKLNVCASTVDTAASRIAKNKVRPYILTNDSDMPMQERAKDLQKFLDGQFRWMGVYEQFQRGFVDAAVLQLGPTKFFTKNGNVYSERVNPEEILVDDADAIYGKPTQLHQVKYYDRFELANSFPEHTHAIMACRSAFGSSVNAIGAGDIIKVNETWKRMDTSGSRNKPGMHVICIDGADLVAEEYKKDYFPFVFQRWKPRLVGFYGVALVDEIAGIQILIDRVIRMIERGITTVAVPRVWLESTSAVNKNTISNLVGSIGEYTGTPPTIAPGQAFTVEVYEFLNMLIRWAYEFPGVSQMSATSKKPDGLDSGAAIREYNQIETIRFQLTEQRYEQIHIEAAKIVIDKMKDLKKAGVDVEVNAGDSKFVDRIKWSDVDMERDKYEIGVFPSSLLPAEPAGRMQKAIELVQAGFVEKEMAMSLLDFPDVEGTMSLKTAAYDDIRMVLSHIIKTGEYIPPEPYMNLQLCLSVSQSTYLKCKTRNAEEDTLENLRRFIDDTVALIAKASQPPAPVGPAMATDPDTSPEAMAVPQAAPTSDILPIGGQA